MNDKSIILRKLTMRINRIERFGGIALEENDIMSMQRFYNMGRENAQSFLLNVITDLQNFRTEFKKTGAIKFYSNIYINMFKQIGLTVKENCTTYGLAHIAFLEMR